MRKRRSEINGELFANYCQNVSKEVLCKIYDSYFFSPNFNSISCPEGALLEQVLCSNISDVEQVMSVYPESNLLIYKKLANHFPFLKILSQFYFAVLEIFWYNR